MDHYSTETVTEVRFTSRVYPTGTAVRVLSPLVDDGVCLVRFPAGEETYLAAWRLVAPPARATGKETT